MKLGCPGHVVIRASLTERDLPEGLEDGRLSGRQIKPTLEIVRVGQRPGGSGEVVIQPGCGDSAAALGYVQLRNGSPQTHRPLDGHSAIGILDDERAGFAFHDRQRADGRAVRCPFHPHGSLPYSLYKLAVPRSDRIVYIPATEIPPANLLFRGPDVPPPLDASGAPAAAPHRQDFHYRNRQGGTRRGCS